MLFLNTIKLIKEKAQLWSTRAATAKFLKFDLEI